MLTTAEVKAHLRIEHDDEDTFIDTLTQAAYVFAENYTGLKILNGSVVEKFDNFTSEIELKYNPVNSITTITYYDTDDTQQSQTDYFLDTKKQKAILKPVYGEAWPATNCNYENIEITYDAGYATISDDINQAVLLIIGSLYEQRENHISGVSIDSVPVSSEYLLSPYRIVSV